MLRSLFNSGGQGWTVGIDVGTEHAKLICLNVKGETRQLMAAGMYKRNNLKGIKDALHHPAIRNGNIRIGFAEPTMKIHPISLPQVPEKELDEVVKWAVKDLEGSPEDYVFRYVRTPGPATEAGLPYVVFAIERQKLEIREQELRELGLSSKANIMEPNANALANTVVFNNPPENNDRYAVIDFGKEQTLFLVVSASGLLFARYLTDISGNKLTFLIGQDQGIPEPEAEAYKISQEDLLRGPGSANTQGVIQYLSKSALEIQLALDKYTLQYPEEHITRIYITAGGSRLKILKPYIQDTLKIATEYLDPFQKIDTSRVDAQGYQNAKEYYAVAMGLAL